MLETRSDFYSKMNAFECLSYMYYIYTRKNHKEENLGWKISLKKSLVSGSIPKDILVRGSSPKWKDTFSIDDKGGDIYHMQR
jgi:hypothetical protein